MKPNTTVIGMPSSDRGTVGVLLAKRLGFLFMGADIMIREKEDRLLKEIIAQEGVDGFLKIEERTNAEPDMALSVIAPGESIIYDEGTMEHLKGVSGAVYLKMNYGEAEKRIGDMANRDVALKPGFTLRDLHNEYVPCYEKHASITVDEGGKTPGDTVDALRDIAEGMMNRNMIECIVEEQKKIPEEKGHKAEAYEAEIVALEEELALLRTAETA